MTLPKVGGCDSMGGAQDTMSVATTDTSVQTEDIQGTFLPSYQIVLIYIYIHVLCLLSKVSYTNSAVIR